MKILIAEDDLVSRIMLEGILRDWGHDVICAEDGDSAYWLLQNPDAPRVALLDWVMPVMDGIQVCRLLRAQKDRPYIYLILLTVREGLKNLVEGLQAGADEYLTKPYDPAELMARLGAAQRIVDLQDQLIAARETLREHATRDALTGLWNRRLILELFDRELARGRRLRRSTGVLLADIDFFKQINDTHGHPIGDVVLRSVGQRFLNIMRPYDLVGRYGGEEFLIVVPECSRENLLTVAEKLRRGVVEEPVVVEEKSIKVTVSFGGVLVEAKDQPASSVVFSRADEALYRAKNEGRNRAVIV